MKVALIGDIHGEFRALQELLKRVPADASVIQVGDFGIWPHKLKEWVDPGRPIMFLDGNHDAPIDLVTGEWKNAQYLPRGTVLELGDSVVLTCGGATSVDRTWRGHRSLESHGWFEEEEVTERNIHDALRNLAGRKPGLMITHTPPERIIKRNFPPEGLLMFGHDPTTWRDLSAINIETLWDAVGNPPLVCGHMHRSLVVGNVRILDINEVYIVEV